MVKGKYSWGICDRSGMKFLRKDMVKEPGTGLMVHKRESDGKWNIVQHPRNHIKTKPEKINLSWVRPEQDVFDWSDYIQMNDGLPIHDVVGIPIEEAA